jgi:hypothetical protein
MRLGRSASGSVINSGDKIGDDLGNMTLAEREIRQSTVNLILGLFRRGGEFKCTKVRARQETKTTPGGFYTVSGYVTMLKFVNHKTVPELELVTGMAPGLLHNGADIFFIEDDLAPEQIAPRYTSEWPAGLSPRDFLTTGTTPHPSYPSSTDPIFQCVIFQNKPARARLVACLNYGDTFSWPAP